MRAMTAFVAATALLIPASAFAAVQTTTHHCGNGTSSNLNARNMKLRAQYCTHSTRSTTSTSPSTRSTPTVPVVDRPGGGQPAAPSKREVSRERWNELMQNCVRGPSRDALSAECMAALPGIAPEPGAAGPPPASPVTLAMVRESAMDQISMGAPKIGASPCLGDPNSCRGTVGVPVWLWADDAAAALPSESATATAGPYSITATAKVSKVKWSLGDGQSTVCSGTGTKYSADVHGWSSPHCGFENGWKQAGTYTLTASYVWDISWSGDQAGSATQTLSSTRQVTVGELQSVATSTG